MHILSTTNDQIIIKHTHLECISDHLGGRRIWKELTKVIYNKVDRTVNIYQNAWWQWIHPVLRLKVSGASFFRTADVEKDFIACIGPIEKST